MEGGHFDPFGDNDDNDNDDNDNDDDEKSFLKALQLRWGALKNVMSHHLNCAPRTLVKMGF